MSKIMRVYYDNAGHPYKDYSLSTLYPIVGNEFTGANNTTEIHFYTDNLGIATWVANCKLPNGSLLNRLLVPEIDGDGHTYFNLPLDSELTSVVGHLKIGLNGYAGNISIDEEELENNDLVVISGTPTIIATGIIDIAMNYSPITIPISSLTPSEYQELLAIIGSKLDSNKGIIVVEQLDNENVVGNNGQLVYDKTTKLFYRVVNGAYQLENFDIGELQVNGNKLKLVLNGIASDISDINSALLTKLDKIYTANKLYGTDDVGQQKAYSISDIVNQVEITTLADYYNKAQIDEKEQYVLEVAEGRCQCFILEYGETILSTNNYAKYKYIDENGEMKLFESKEQLESFIDGFTNANSSFNSEVNFLYITSSKYIIVNNKNISGGENIFGLIIKVSQFELLFKEGDIIWVTETDVPDRWVNECSSSYIKLGKLETTNLSDVVNISNTQTISGKKSFTGGITLSASSENQFAGIINIYTNLSYPFDNEYSIGNGSYRVKDIYLGGNLSDGTYSTTVEKLSYLYDGYYGKQIDMTTISWKGFNVLMPDTNTTLSLETAPSVGYKPEYKGSILNTENSAITLTFTGVSTILCNDDNIVITNGTNSTLTLPAGTSIEFSIVNGKMVAINWSAN